MEYIETVVLSCYPIYNNGMYTVGKVRMCSVEILFQDCRLSVTFGMHTWTSRNISIPM